jgi:hypothetical protein
MPSFDSPPPTSVDDLALAVGELVECGEARALGRGASRERLHDPARDAGRQQRLAGRDTRIGAQQLSGLCVLDARSRPAPGTQRLEDVLVELERRQHEHADGLERGSATIRRVASSRRGPACGCP